MNLISSKSEYAKNITTMLIGSGIRQFIPVLISPLLTRLFAPTDFGLFGIYLSIIMVLTTINTGRLELAIMLPKKNSEVYGIIALSLLFNVIVTFFCLVGAPIYFLISDKPFGLNEFFLWMFILPLSLFSKGIFNITYYWHNRLKQYVLLSKSKIYQAISTAALSVAFGYIGYLYFGLIIAELIGQLVPVLILVFFLKNNIPLIKSGFSKIKTTWHNFKNFPIYAIPADLFNILAMHIPVFFLDFFFTERIVGFYFLLLRILGAPISLLALSVMDVFKEKASADYNQLGNFKSIYLKTFRNLFLMALLPFGIILLWAPPLFSFFFGSDWEMVGEFAQLVTPMFFARFIAFPLSYIFYILKKEKEIMFWNIATFIVSSTGLFIGYFYSKSYEGALICFSIAHTCALLCQLLRTTLLSIKEKIN